jgi:L-asparaginase II
MLLACVANGWPIDDYGKPDHPLQRETFRVLATFAGVPEGTIEYGVDNCHVPTFRLPVAASATAFARLATSAGLPSEYARAAERVRIAMMAHPEMVAGEDRFDTDLMRAANGAIVMKGGADGFQGLGLPGAGLGLAVKISDGGSRALPPAVARILEGLAVLDSAILERVSQHTDAPLYDLHGDLVGRVVPVFAVGKGT